MSTITELNPRLSAITEAGVSVWLDQIRRSMVEGGERARMVEGDPASAVHGRLTDRIKTIVERS